MILHATIRGASTLRHEIDCDIAAVMVVGVVTFIAVSARALVMGHHDPSGFAAGRRTWRLAATVAVLVAETIRILLRRFRGVG
jgi:hypothetical protein